MNFIQLCLNVNKTDMEYEFYTALSALCINMLTFNAETE